MIVFPTTQNWLDFFDHYFSKDARKGRAIETIKAQPFFNPRMPHPFEGMQWSADELDSIREQGTKGLAIQHMPPLDYSITPFDVAVDSWAAQFKGADFGEPGGDKTAVVEGTRFKDGTVRIDRITEHDSYAAAPSPVPGLEMFGIPLQKSRCQCRKCLRDRNEGVSMGGVLWPIEATRMILCPECGNKRCPHATDHRNACTGSNEPGQPGSAYGPEIPKPGVWFDEAWELDE